MTALELEQLLRRVVPELVRQELAAHEARRVAGETSSTAVDDDVEHLAAELAAGARRARSKPSIRARKGGR